MKVLRAGILGCGGFGHRHAENILKLPEQVSLAAFCDRHAERAQAYAQRYTAGKAGVYTDHHEMMTQAGLDLLVVCLPPYGHSDEVESAAAHGVHLLMEKPIALSSAQGWQMVAAAEAAGIVTQVGFMFRFGQAVEALKAQIESGESGPVGLMSARYFCNDLHAPWWRSRQKSGGQLVEQVIHMVDLMRHLLGEAATVYSRQENRFHQDTPGYDIEDASATVIGFRSGALGVIYATNGAIPGQWINDYRLVAGRVTAEFSDANHATFHWTAQPGVPQQVIAGERDVYQAELQDLLEAIHTGRPARTPLRQGALSLDLALAATASADRHAEMSLP